MGILRGSLQDLAICLDAVTDERRRQCLAGFRRQEAGFEMVLHRLFA